MSCHHRSASPAWQHTRRWIVAHSCLFLALLVLDSFAHGWGHLFIRLVLVPALLVGLQGWLVRRFRSRLDWWGVSGVAMIGASVVAARIADQANWTIALSVWATLVGSAQACLLPGWYLRGVWLLGTLATFSGIAAAWVTILPIQAARGEATGCLLDGASILVYLLATGSAIWLWTSYAAPPGGPPMGKQVWGHRTDG